MANEINSYEPWQLTSDWCSKIQERSHNVGQRRPWLEEDKQFQVAGTSMHVPCFLSDGAVWRATPRSCQQAFSIMMDFDPQVENQNNSPSLLLLLGMFVIKREVSNYHTCYSSLKVVVERLQAGSPHLLNLMWTQKERDFKWQRQLQQKKWQNSTEGKDSVFLLSVPSVLFLGLSFLLCQFYKMCLVYGPFHLLSWTIS